MRSALAAGALLAIGVSGCGSAGSKVSAGGSPADSAAVAEAVDQFLEAFSNLDWDAFRASWSAHPSVFFPMDSLPALADGRSQVEAGFAGVFTRARAARARRPSNLPPPGIHPRELKIAMYGDAAVVTFMLGPPEGRMGRRTLVLVREDGGWKIAHLHGSTAGFQ